jgi:hypothetical protein
MLFNSRGFKDAAAVKGDELEASLVAASQGGKIPIVCDTSPCLSQIKGSLSDSRLKCAPVGPLPGSLPVKLARCSSVGMPCSCACRPLWGGTRS